MNKKWLLIGFLTVGGFMLLFTVSVLIARSILGESTRLVTGEGIGLVEVKGVIIDSAETVKHLHDFSTNDSVKAVVLRIDSPGGVVGPSQEIYEEVKKLASRKKVIVSMGSVAASGGYYIAAPATEIYANPGTLTGSIGVLMKMSNVEGLLGKVGLKAFTLKSGRFKDAGSPLRPLTPEDQAILQGVIDNLHGQFVKAVVEGRKLPIDQVKSIADGRVLSGEQALNLKLIDKLGTQQDAVSEAARLVGIKGEPRIIKPPQKKKLFMDLLVEEAAGKISQIAGQANGGPGGLSVHYELDGLIR